MEWSKFIVVGENIHCTRVVKRDGSRVAKLADGREGLPFKFDGQSRFLPLPSDWERISPALAAGNIKHAALGLWQAMHGKGDEQRAGEDYLAWLAQRQIEAGATFLDVNVDEFTRDHGEAAEAMGFLVELLGRRFELPLSIDSSHAGTLRAGLSRCRREVGAPLVNSISLERLEALELVVEFGAEVIVGAAGREGMPADADERLVNLERMLAETDRAGVARGRLHLDPLVLPISTDPLNGGHLLEAIRRARAQFAGVHLTGGFSNVSFGMPNRKLLNMVFVWLCVEAGADGGIIDPTSMSVADLAAQDAQSEPFRLARAVLTGEDMFGVEYIAAHRDGRI